ncbi:hypothetical protein [Halonotius roseus]|uniref:Uncharacterized protein n=1 Tax=Halonotius roseus TaxID=2511997 RepID=A0A544QR12_9EURY|nr:hypothetical protein [Halonotius roseus]TQQ81878.1 hypothetical protein EWF95_02770 [Halonotius roseus]
MNDHHLTATEYRAEIESSAECAVDEIADYTDIDIGSDEFERQCIQEGELTADCHQWSIYAGYSTDILRHAKNDPEEWQCFVDPEMETDHRHVLKTMAYCAFRMDLYEAVVDEVEARREQSMVVA